MLKIKKILSIIAIALCIFQLVVLATAIDIGSAATTRGSGASTSTVVAFDNPANETGTITSVEIYAVWGNMTDVEVATFYVESGNNLSTRDSEAIADVVLGAKRTFPVDLDVEAGDYLGVYFSGGGLYRDDSGDGYWVLYSDGIPASDVTFTWITDKTISLYGTGATAQEKGTSIMFTLGGF